MHNINPNKHYLKPVGLKRHKEKINSIPEETGVYQFSNVLGNVIYVGKSINLKKRVSGYFNFNFTERHSRTLRLIRDIEEISWEVTNSELLALLREDELIKKHWPEYNVKQKEFLKYIYLTFTDDKFPKLQIVIPDHKFHQKNIFGPFKDSYYLENFLKILYELFPLRTCKDFTEKRTCIKYDIGQCAGPCREGITEKEYYCIVQNVVVFLFGSDPASLHKLEQKMSKHSAGLEFEKAQDLKRKIGIYHFYSKRQKFIKRFRERILMVNEKGRYQNAFLFKHGKLVFHQRKNIDFNTFDVSTIPLLNAGTGPEYNWRIIDRANVVYSWINNKKSEKEFHYII